MGLFSGQPRNDGRLEHGGGMEEDWDSPVEALPSASKPQQVNTTIAKGVTVVGALRGEGVVQVEGSVEGEVDLKGSVIVTKTGCIRGPITSDVIRIAGRVEGDITAREHLRLEKSGNIIGDVTTWSLVVEDGARFDGRSSMLETQQGEPDYTQSLLMEEI